MSKKRTAAANQSTRSPEAPATLGAATARAVLETVKRYSGVRFSNGTDRDNCLRALEQLPVETADAEEPNGDDADDDE